MSRLLLTFLLFGAASLVASSSGEQLRARLVAAEAGATVIVEAGDYDGPFVIKKSVRLLGRPGAILRGDGHDHVISITAPDVEIAGFTIRGSGRDLARDQAAIHVTGANAVIRDNRILDSLHGIYIRQASHCQITGNTILGEGITATPEATRDPIVSQLRPGSDEMCDINLPQDRRGNGIHLWNSAGHLITGNTIAGTRDGIYFSFADNTVVRENLITHVRYGLHYMYSDDNTFEENTFTDNAAGSALMYSKGIVLRANRFVANRSHRAYGILFQAVDNTVVENNLIEGNTLGFYIENSTVLTVRNNRIGGNYIGLRLSDSTSESRIYANHFFSNIHPVETSGGNIANMWSLDGRGNHWQGAFALDLNRDGVSDLPHREPDLFGPWRRSFPAIGLLSASPGERLLRFVHARVEVPGIPGIRDPHPLLSPP